MAKSIRFWLGIALTLSVFPVIGDFFVELARQQGLYENPEGKVLNIFAQISTSAWYPYTLGGFIGLFLGAWLNHFTSKRDPDNNLMKPEGAKDLEFENFDLENKFEVVTGQHFANEKITVDGKKFVRCEFRNVTLEFNASKPFSIDTCKFYGFQISTRNRYAERMVSILVAFGWIKFPARDNGKIIEAQASYRDLSEESPSNEQSKISPQKG